MSEPSKTFDPPTGRAVPEHTLRTGPSDLVVALAGAAVVGLLWIALLWRYRYWIATNDHAIFQLALEQMRDGEIPLVGPYSRLGFRHPGPAREWLFFLPYVASGGRAAALPATTIVFHLTMFALSMRAGWKWASTRGAATAAVSVLVMFVVFGKQLQVPWNPLLAATAILAAVWGLMMFLRTGRWAQAVLCASLAVQMHVSTAPIAAVIVIIVIALSIASRTGRWSWNDASAAPRWMAPLGLGAFAALWVGPILDMFGSDESNLSAILDATGADDQLGLANALALAGRVVHPAEVITGTYLRPSTDAVTGTSGAVPLLVWALIGLAAVVLAVRSRSRIEVATVATWVALAATLVVSMSRFVPPLFGYLFASVTAVAVAAMAVTASTIVGALTTDHSVVRVRRFDPSVIAAACIAVLMVGGALGVSELNQIVPERRALATNGAVHARVEPGQTYAVRSGGMIAAIVEAEVALQIELSGGDATSHIFSLALPDETSGVPVFIAAMAGVRQCLFDFEVGTLIVDGAIQANREAFGLFLLQPDELRELTQCPPF